MMKKICYIAFAIMLICNGCSKGDDNKNPLMDLISGNYTGTITVPDVAFVKDSVDFTLTKKTAREFTLSASPINIPLAPGVSLDLQVLLNTTNVSLSIISNAIQGNFSIPKQVVNVSVNSPAGSVNSSLTVEGNASQLYNGKPCDGVVSTENDQVRTFYQIRLSMNGTINIPGTGETTVTINVTLKNGNA